MAETPSPEYPGIPSIGFYFHYPTREVFYMGERAGWIVPCSDEQAIIRSYRFLPDDDLYGHHSASNMGSLVQYMKGHIVRVHRKVSQVAV